MRIDPADVVVKKKELDEQNKLKIQKVTRIVALVVAFISTFFFIIKILFL
jgi:preprotein translocase subunit SecY